MKQGPGRVASILLCIMVLSVGVLDSREYGREFHQNPNAWMDVVAGTADAPAQYRIGVVDTASFLARHGHLALGHVFTVLDVLSGLAAVFVLFWIFGRSMVYRRAGLTAQWFGAASFLILMQFYLSWVIWYQRPETLPTAAMLAVALVLLAVRLPLRNTLGTVGAVGGMLLLAVAQGYVRADVALALHAGILLVCFTPLGNCFALGRRVQAGTSLVAMMLAGGIQYDLMRRVFPHASYGDTPVLQLFLNLQAPSTQLPFFLFLVPFGWTAVMLMRRRYRVDSAGAGVFAGAVIFMGMWLVVGRIKEVRIFLPFALALAPLTVELAMQRFLPEHSEPA
jgi:hypothetical protein